VNSWVFQPLDFFAFVLLVLGYLYLWRQSTGGRVQHSLQRCFLYFTGLLLFILATFSGLEGLAHYLLTARAAQHLILAYLVPPLLWAGLGQGLLSPILLRTTWVQSLLYHLGKPISAALYFNGCLISWYFPFMTEFSRNHHWGGQMEHLSVLLAGAVMWLPLMNPMIHQRPPFARQMFYLMTLILTQVPLFGLLALSKQAHYQAYILAPRISSLSAYGDQQSAGWLIKLVSILVFAGAFIAIVLQWSHYQRRVDRSENRVALENIDLIKKVRATWPQGEPQQGPLN
jgi:cytochrome c oxidase assembly factor CtaG